MRARIERTSAWIDVHRTLVGALTAGLIVLALLAVFVGVPGLRGAPGQQVRAMFGTTTSLAGAYQLAPDRQLIRGAPVRVGGIDVGVVERVELQDGGRSTLVTMRVEDVDVHQDARAEIAFRTLLGGNLQIKLDPGSESAPALGAGTIPVERTGDQVAFDDLFEPFDRPTRKASRDTFRGLADAVADPAATGAATERLGPDLETLGEGVTPLLGGRPGDLAKLVSAGARAVGALDEESESLERLVARADQTLEVTRRRRGDIGAFLEASPAALRATDEAVARIDPTLDRLDPLVRDLRPGARGLDPAARAATPALRQADALLDEAQPLLRDAGPAFTALRGAAGTGLPLIDAFDPLLDRLNETTLPFLNRVDPDYDLKVHQAIGPAVGAAASAGSLFDSEGFFFYFPDEPTLRSLGVNPCAPDLSAIEKTKCESLLDVLERALQGGEQP